MKWLLMLISCAYSWEVQVLWEVRGKISKADSIYKKISLLFLLMK